MLGDGQKSKTWLLLANAADPTLLRNTVCFNLAWGRRLHQAASHVISIVTVNIEAAIF